MKTTIKFPKSDSFAFLVTINKIAKALDNAFFTVKENPDEEPVLQKKLGAGISLADSRLYKNQLSYKVQIDGADTANMEVGVRYFFDVKGTIGNAQKTFLWGELILSETETGYLNPAMQGDTTAIAQVYTATFETGAQSQYVETESDPVATAKIGDMTKLNTTAKDMIVKAINEVNAPTFTESATLDNVVSGEKQSTLWSKVKKWFSSLKALAFKDKVGTVDITDGSITTAKFASDAKCPNASYATSAGSASSATNANYATSAGSATSATNATNADKAIKDGQGNNIAGTYLKIRDGVQLFKTTVNKPATTGLSNRITLGTVPTGKTSGDIMAVSFRIDNCHYQGIAGGNQDSAVFDCQGMRYVDDGLLVACVRVSVTDMVDNIMITFDNYVEYTISSSGNTAHGSSTSSGMTIGVLKEVSIYFK